MCRIIEQILRYIRFSIRTNNLTYSRMIYTRIIAKSNKKYQL